MIKYFGITLGDGVFITAVVAVFVVALHIGLEDAAKIKECAIKCTPYEVSSISSSGKCVCDLTKVIK